METKTLELVSKALVGIGLGYLAYAVATMPKELQKEVKQLADNGTTEEIKKLVDFKSDSEQEETDKEIPDEREPKFLPSEDKDC